MTQSDNSLSLPALCSCTSCSAAPGSWGTYDDPGKTIKYNIWGLTCSPLFLLLLSLLRILTHNHLKQWPSTPAPPPSGPSPSCLFGRSSTIQDGKDD